jgi:uncharacterized surface protein with fasciclin (FAS1) repeats
MLVTTLLMLFVSACNVNVAVEPTAVATPAAGTIPSPTAVEASAEVTATTTITETGTITDADTDTMTDTGVLTDTAPLTATEMATGTAVTTSTATLTGTATTTATGVTSPMDLLPDTSAMTINEIVQTLDSLSILATAVDTAGIGDALDVPGPITLFAPADAAFEAVADDDLQALLADPVLLAEVLQYHLIVDSADSAELARLGSAQSTLGEPLAISVGLNGELLINNAQVVFADIPAANGTIHVINQILTPPDSGLTLPAADPAFITLMSETPDATLEELKRADTSDQTIVEVLSSVSGLSIAARAIDAAGLTAALEQPGPFTIFVPTDPAFSQLPNPQLEDLLNDSAALADVLQYHLVLDTLTSADLATLPTILTAAGETLTVTVQSNGRILLNGTPVYQTDIEASNGIIHVIGEVLTPIGQ